ncbi:MAG: HIT domain-containing protein [Chloroflexi bacterium]|nr:HIT domain-containing protein [Chloroflexota bacterium]
MAEDCVFCKIRDGQIRSDILFRDEHCFVIRDIAPKAPTHLLIIPNQHFTYLTGLTPGFLPAIGGMFMAAQEMAKREGVADTGYRLIINQGEYSGQVVPHLHLHLLGGRRLGGMG